MPALLALASGFVVGTSDFLGGLAGRRGRLGAVVVWSQLIGVGTIVLISVLIGGNPTAAELWWGTAAGVCGSIGVATLYRGFTVSDIGVVAPISAVGAAALPVLGGLLIGERPGWVALSGVVLGLLAIYLITQTHPERAHLTFAGVVHGAGAGVGFAAMFILLSFTDVSAGTWPLVPGRAAGASLFTIGALVLRQELKPVDGTWPPIVGAGVLAMVGNGLYLLAVQRGLLSLVAVLTSLYPAASVMWARVVLHERMLRVQLLGFVLALGAVTLILAG